MQAGDTLKSLARRVYGNEAYWYVLADANGLDEGSALVAGSTLTVPEVRTSLNDANTFKPYNPADVTGPTTPSLPYIPPAAAACNPIATIIMVVVAIAVTVYTAGAAATALSGATSALGSAGAAAAGGFSAVGGAALTGAATIGTSGIALGAGAAFGGAVVGGFAGSVASQLVGKAAGWVDSFSLRSAVASGIGAGLTAGLAGKLGGSTAQLMERGASAANAARIAGSALGNAVGSYVAGKIAGVQDTSFSWKAIAASAVGSLLTAKANQALGLNAESAFGGTDQLGQDVVGGLVGGVVSLHTRRAAGFDDPVNYGQILADAFGNALGNEAVRGMSSGSNGLSRDVAENPFGLEAMLAKYGAPPAAAVEQSTGQVQNPFGLEALLSRFGNDQGGMTVEEAAGRPLRSPAREISEMPNDKIQSSTSRRTPIADSVAVRDVNGSNALNAQGKLSALIGSYLEADAAFSDAHYEASKNLVMAQLRLQYATYVTATVPGQYLSEIASTSQLYPSKYEMMTRVPAVIHLQLERSGMLQGDESYHTFMALFQATEQWMAERRYFDPNDSTVVATDKRSLQEALRRMLSLPDGGAFQGELNLYGQRPSGRALVGVGPLSSVIDGDERASGLTKVGQIIYNRNWAESLAIGYGSRVWEGLGNGTATADGWGNARSPELQDRKRTRFIARTGATLDAIHLVTDISNRTGSARDFMQIDVYADPQNPGSRKYLATTMKYDLARESFIRYPLYSDDIQLQKLLGD